MILDFSGNDRIKRKKKTLSNFSNCKHFSLTINEIVYWIFFAIRILYLCIIEILKKKRKVVIDHHRWDALFLPRKYSKIFRKFPQVWQTLNTNIYQLAITFSFSDSNRKLQNSGTTLTRVQLICFVNSIRKSVDVSVELIFIVSRNIRDFYESWKSSIIREIHSFHAFRN